MSGPVRASLPRITASPSEETQRIVGHLVLPDGQVKSLGLNRRITIGSDQGCSIRIESDGVAPNHCTLVAREHYVVVEDAGSETSTFVNNELVPRQILENGDVIRVGPVELRFAGVKPAVDPGRTTRRVLWAALSACAAGILVAGVYFGTRHSPDSRRPVAQTEQMCTLSVESSPGSAEVYVENTRRGRTPLTLDLRRNKAHSVVVTLPGYKPWQAAVPQGLERYTVTATLEKLPTGRLVVRSAPHESGVYLDDVYVGGTPLEMDTAVGQRRVKLSSASFEPHEETVAVSAERPAVIAAVLRCDDTEHFTQWVSENPRNAQAHFELATALMTRHDLESALSELRLTLGLLAAETDSGGWKASAPHMIVNTYVNPPIPGAKSEEVEQVRKKLESLFVAVIEGRPDTYLLDGFVKALAQVRKKDLAIRLCEKAAAANPQALRPYLCMADAYLACQDYAGSESALTVCDASCTIRSKDRVVLGAAWARLIPQVEAAGTRARGQLDAVLKDCRTDAQREALLQEFRKLAGRNAESVVKACLQPPPEE